MLVLFTREYLTYELDLRIEKALNEAGVHEKIHKNYTTAGELRAQAQALRNVKAWVETKR